MVIIVLFRCRKNEIDNILLRSKRKRIKELSDELDNILFLDYDGVINLDINNYGHKTFDKNSIDNLNKFCHKHNMKIVVISSWRKYPNYKKILYQSGLDCDIDIIGKTIFLGSRESEIKDYLKNNPYIGKFIILDDGEYDLLSKYQIKTKYDEGFNNKKYLEAEKLFMEFKI